MNDPYWRRASLIRVIDGDTLRLRVDLGWNAFSDHNVRLLDVDTPEKRGLSRPSGLMALNWVTLWLKDHDLGFPWPYLIRSEKDDSFGRYLVELHDLNGASLNTALLASGHATVYTR